MVFIESKKYACETCIKGHRSSACKHTDRPLFEIKKKGRPVTQCEHCRELRKTKQVHVKCICEMKTDTSPPKKASIKAPESAAFPNGLPEALALEASVAQLEAPSDLHLYGGVAHSCSCADGGACTCCTPRKPAPRPRRKTEPAPLSTAAASVTAVAHAGRDVPGANEVPPRASSHILARISELRPVLPRPSGHSSPHHDPSSGFAHGHGNRHHEDSFFSPYGRAYDINHPHHPHTADEGPRYPFSPPPPKTQETYDRAAANSISNTSQPSITFPSPCGCGDGCSCPGCFHHNNAPFAPSAIAYPTCSNPATCNACLDCTILSLPPDTTLSIPQPQQAEAIDEWIRQVQANPNSIMMATDVDKQFAGWDSLSQSTTRRRQCATCSTFFCTCEKESSDSGSPSEYHSVKSPCCHKPLLDKSADMGTLITPPDQGHQVYGSSDLFDYSLFGMPPSVNTYLDVASNVVGAFRSRSPSISPSSSHEFPPQLSTAFPYPTFIDKMPPTQQTVFINGRGFYSDTYLTLNSDERIALDAHSSFLTLPLSSIDHSTGSYAISNPDSDASLDSLDDLAPPVPQQSVSPVSFEEMRPLY